MKFIASLIVATFLPLSLAAPAEATRPIVGSNYPDVCKNIRGKQPIWMVVGATARFQFDTSTRRPNDCVKSPTKSSLA